MVFGVSGVAGLSALSPVEVEREQAPGAVIILLQKMMVCDKLLFCFPFKSHMFLITKRFLKVASLSRNQTVITSENNLE